MIDKWLWLQNNILKNYLAKLIYKLTSMLCVEQWRRDDYQRNDLLWGMSLFHTLQK